MLQEGGLYPTLACVEIWLRLAARQYASPLPVERLLSALGLEAVAGTRVRHLSGGERRRLAFAVAVVGRPSLVFLDEPTAGLDVEVDGRTWALLERLRTDGVTALLDDRHLEEAERLSDQVRIVARGGRWPRGRRRSWPRRAPSPVCVSSPGPGCRSAACLGAARYVLGFGERALTRPLPAAGVAGPGGGGGGRRAGACRSWHPGRAGWSERAAQSGGDIPGAGREAAR